MLLVPSLTASQVAIRGQTRKDGAWQLGQSVAARALPGSARPSTAWVVVTAIFSLQSCKQWSSLTQTDSVAVCSELDNNHLVGTVPVSVASLTALEILYARPSFEITCSNLAQAAAAVVAVAVVVVAADAVVAAAITETLGGAGQWPRLTQLISKML